MNNPKSEYSKLKITKFNLQVTFQLKARLNCKDLFLTKVVDHNCVIQPIQP